MIESVLKVRLAKSSKVDANRRGPCVVTPLLALESVEMGFVWDGYDVFIGCVRATTSRAILS